MHEAAERAKAIVSRSIAKSLKAIVFLLKIMIPTSLAVTLLGWSGILGILASVFVPVMRLVGLPGEAAFAFISGALLTNYSAIAVMGTLSLSVREATIIAVMCLIAHNLVMETSVMKSTGSSGVKMLFLRLGMAIIGALLLNLLLPASLASVPFSSGAAEAKGPFLQMLWGWAVSTFKLVGRIVVFVTLIMLIQETLEEVKAMDFLSGMLSPFMKLFGLPGSASFMWIVVNVVGYTYGAGILKNQYEAGKLTRPEGDLFNHHAAISHSLLEDTLLYAAVSLPVAWLMLPRLALSAIVVWVERLRRRRLKRSLRVGTV